MYFCIYCSDDVDYKRWHLGYHSCLRCGDLVAKDTKHTIVPMHKSNYVPIFNPQDLVGINSKSGSRC